MSDTKERTAPSAWQIEQAMSAASALVEMLGQDAEDEGLRLDTIEGETDAAEIARRLIRVALDCEAMSHAVQGRINDLDKRRARFEHRAEAARETVKTMLDVLGLHRLQDAEFSASLKLGPPKVVITEPEALADEFVRIKREPDKPLIRAALDAGREVRGATKSNGSTVLAIRTK